MPVQSGSNKILKKMNRNYTQESYKHIVDIAYKKMPNLSISSDIIVGFPGECTLDFRESINILKYTGYSNVFISQYSPRPKTVSYIYNTDDVCKSVKLARHNYMLKTQSHLSCLKNYILVDQIFKAHITYIYDSDFYVNKVILIAKTHGNQQVIFTFNSKFFFDKEILIRVTKVYKSKVFGEILL
jgi:tRNA-2-methylthio-N6-dimethylallyladenosine synthase